MRIISGIYKGQRLKTVSGPGYRPAMGKVREAVFSILAARGVVWSATRVLDLFAGSGSLGFEALSRGAPVAVFVENDKKAATCLEQNAANLNCLDRARIVREDALRFLRGNSAKFDLVFIDPPYGYNLLAHSARLLLARDTLLPGAFLLAEVEHNLVCPPELSPEKAAEHGLELELDRLYGQTRIMIWHKNA